MQPRLLEKVLLVCTVSGRASVTEPAKPDVIDAVLASHPVAGDWFMRELGAPASQAVLRDSFERAGQ